MRNFLSNYSVIKKKKSLHKKISAVAKKALALTLNENST